MGCFLKIKLLITELMSLWRLMEIIWSTFCKCLLDCHRAQENVLLISQENKIPLFLLILYMIGNHSFLPE